MSLPTELASTAKQMRVAWKTEHNSLLAAAAAQTVLHNYEHHRPDDLRPRKAINAALRCIKWPTERNQNSAHRASERSHKAVLNLKFARMFGADKTDGVESHAALNAALSASKAAELASSTPPPEYRFRKQYEADLAEVLGIAITSAHYAGATDRQILENLRNLVAGSDAEQAVTALML